MKILNIVKTNVGATWAFNQAKACKQKNINVVTILPKENGKMKERYESEGIKVIEEDFSLPTKQPWKIYSRIKTIRKIINDEKPDIIHTHFVTNILMLRIALRKDKTIRVFQVPGPLHLENKIFKWLDIITANENDYWIATCKKTYQIYKDEKISNKKIFLSYYGMDNADTYNEPTGKLKKEFGLNKEDIIIGMVSYFYKPKRYLGQTRGLKGHEDFIDAINILTKENKNIKGVIIGNAWGNSQKYEQKVKKYAKKISGNNVIFTGFREDLKDIYKELDVVVHPSHSENLGGAAESLAAGVPTVATNIGGFPDIIIDGKTGYLCEVSNPKSIANCVNKILYNKQKTKELVKEGMKLEEELLNLDKASDSIIKIYKKIITNRRKI